MKNLKQKILDKPVISILCTVLFVQLIMIAYCNFTVSRDNIDCDSAKLYVHAIEMWRNKTFLIPDWSYITTLELDCSLLLAVPLFGLLGDIYTAFSISNLIFLVLLIWVIFRLFSNKDASYPLLASILICIPYGIGQLDYMNMLFFNGSQYMIKVMLPLMLMVLLLNPYDIKSKDRGYHIKELVFMAIYFLLLFVTGFSSGAYVAVTGLFPVIVGSFLWRLYNREKVTWSFWLYSGLSGGVTLAGLVLNAVCEINSKGNSMALCDVYGQLQDNISSCLIGIFEVFGGAAYANVEVLSYAGLNILARMFFVFLILGCAYFVWRKIVNRKAVGRPAVLLAIFLWNTFILSICNVRYGAPTFEYRYHLMGALPLLCITAEVMLDWYNSCEKKTKLFGVLAALAVLLVLNATSYRAVFQSKKDYSHLQEICDFANENGVDYVYFFDSESAEICRLLDYEGANYLTAMVAGWTVVYDYYEKYVEAPVILGNEMLVWESEEETVEMFGRTYVRYAAIGGRGIYR